MKKFIPLLLTALLSLSVNGAAVKEIHQHKMLELSPDTPVPQITLEVYRDETDGVNVHIRTNQYVLNAPHSQAQESEFLTGHAHLFINSKKVQRVYGADVHLPASLFRQGVNQIAVSLISHQHENYTKKGQFIVVSLYID